MPAKKTPANGKHENQPLSAFTAMSGDMPKVFAQMQETYARQTEAMREELARFAEARMQGTAKTIESLSQCKNPLEAMGVQQQWLMNLGRSYLDESWKLMGMVGEAMKKQQEQARKTPD